MDDLISKLTAVNAVEEIGRVATLPDGDEVIRKSAVKYTLSMLPSAQPEQKWIPCSKRLPHQGQEVICQCRASIIKVLKLDADGDWFQDAGHCYMGGFVIAWMPLPAPYKEGGADG